MTQLENLKVGLSSAKAIFLDEMSDARNIESVKISYFKFYGATLALRTVATKYYSDVNKYAMECIREVIDSIENKYGSDGLEYVITE